MSMGPYAFPPAISSYAKLTKLRGVQFLDLLLEQFNLVHKGI
jgi:hypothetical protein